MYVIVRVQLCAICATLCTRRTHPSCTPHAARSCGTPSCGATDDLSSLVCNSPTLSSTRLSRSPANAHRGSTTSSVSYSRAYQPAAVSAAKIRTRTKNRGESFRVANVPLECLLQLATSGSKLLHVAICLATGIVQLRAGTPIAATVTGDTTNQETQRKDFSALPAWTARPLQPAPYPQFPVANLPHPAPDVLTFPLVESVAARRRRSPPSIAFRSPLSSPRRS